MKNLLDKIKLFFQPVVKCYRLAGLYSLKIFNRFYLYIIMAAITIVMVVAGFLVAKYPTGDVVNYIFPWIKDIKEVGFNNFYKIKSDYSPFYLFICAIWSLLPAGKEVTVNGMTYNQNYMYYLKGFYFMCVIGMAIGVFLIVKLLTNSKWKASLAYITTIGLPTVFINAAIWGQADVLIGLGFVYIIFFVMIKKDWLAFLLFGITLGMKVHAIFIAPFLFYLILNRKVRLWTVLCGFIGLLLTFLPAYFCGASFAETFAFFGKQVSEYKDLSYGCGNMWHLLNFRGSVIKDHATIIGLLLIGIFTAGLYLRKINLNDNQNLLKVSIVSIMSVIYFLPHLHERYFYCIDVLLIIYAIIVIKRFYLPILMQVSSCIAYYHYLSGKHFIASWGEDGVHICSFINLFIFAILAYDVFRLDHDNLFEKENAAIEEEIKEIKNSNKD